MMMAFYAEVVEAGNGVVVIDGDILRARIEIRDTPGWAVFNFKEGQRLKIVINEGEQSQSGKVKHGRLRR